MTGLRLDETWATPTGPEPRSKVEQPGGLFYFCGTGVLQRVIGRG